MNAKTLFFYVVCEVKKKDSQDDSAGTGIFLKNKITFPTT
jgi:hypothetical protein